MSSIKIDGQEYYLWLACKDGWNRAVGLKAEICGLEVSLVMLPTQPVELVISEWNTGIGIKRIPISFLNVMMANTKEKAFDLFSQILTDTIPFIKHNGVKNILEMSYLRGNDFETKYGHMPEIEIYIGEETK